VIKLEFKVRLTVIKLELKVRVTVIKVDFKVRLTGIKLESFTGAKVRQDQSQAGRDKVR
jgi:hypothetical protein